MSAAALILAGPTQPARPWPRYTLSPQGWQQMAASLSGEDGMVFQALWADAAQVFALFTTPTPLLVSAPVEAGWYAALSPSRPDASLFERMVADLWGHSAADARDSRPWLDHGSWPVLRPMTARPLPNGGLPEPPEMMAVPGDANHRTPHGPVQSLAEPARIVLTARGETILRAEARLGYAHKGTLALMRGCRLDEAAVLVSRLSGEATVAHALAFARAAEAALQTEPPPRAAALREVMAGLERIAMRLHDRAAVLDAAGHDPAHALAHRETVLRAAHAAFGHRLMMDVALPGGLPRDIAADGPAVIGAALARLPPHRWPSSLVRRAAATRSIGRLDALDAAIATDTATVTATLATLPPGDFRAFLPASGGEGLGRAEGARGVVWHWLRIDAGRVVDAFARDPAWLAWPRAEAAATGTPLADWPLLAASFGLSVSGMDL